jgi:transporter family-2 protein
MSFVTVALTALVVFVAGLGFAVQAPLNASLGRAIGGGIAAATISFGVGFVALLVVSLLSGQGGALMRAPAQSPILLVGGFLGAVTVWAMLWSVPTVGLLTALAALLLGQLCATLVLDHVGAFALPIQQVTPTRVLAVVLVMAGMILSRY